MAPCFAAPSESDFRIDGDPQEAAMDESCFAAVFLRPFSVDGMGKE